jgi:hypothetical protein
MVASFLKQPLKGFPADVMQNNPLFSESGGWAKGGGGDGNLCDHGVHPISEFSLIIASIGLAALIDDGPPWISTPKQQLSDELQAQFNADRSAADRPTAPVGNPHLEIKTQYLYGKEVELIIQQGTVVGIVSASHISQPSRLKLEQAGIAYAENVPLAEFADESSEW